jgi:CDP-diacylglycerol--glycerol-3-phosphate 3-phosphatidyltransferase
MSPSFSKRDEYLNFPNYLTFVRIALIPVVMVLMGFQNPSTSPHYHPLLGYVAAILFVLSGISDVIDGYYARRMKLTSVFGKFFDPLADKLMILTVMIMLIPLGELPAWIVVLFLARELMVTVLRSVAVSEGIIIAADVWGKKKTALQNVALTCFLLPPQFIGVNSRTVGWIVLVLALIVAVFSGVNYCLNFFATVLRKGKKTDF